MEWYYADKSERRGPITEAELDSLVSSGKIDANTQVWRGGWDNWKPFGEAGARTAGGTDSAARCAECGNTFPSNEMVQYEDSWVCPNCKPLFFQKVKEGVDATAAMNYGGFWIRFVAKFVDGIILFFVAWAVQIPLTLFARSHPQTSAAVAAGIISITFSFGIRLAYSTFLVGKYGATVGKMACGLRIVTASGGPVGYGLACGRFFAELLSAMILLIGYIMAAFDDEKRTLHDRICNTRVIRSR